MKAHVGKPLALIRAPSNLGLRPLRPGHEPGVWRAPRALSDAGLISALSPQRIVDLPRPHYSTEEQPGTRLLNGPAMRVFNLALADAVEHAARAREFPLVVGGDCSVLLGALAGRRRLGPLSLVHIDGHSDFRHPGNYDSHGTLGAVGGMDLALATGRGEALMSEWPRVEGALVPDEQVVQLGEREGRDHDWVWPDVRSTDICLLEVFDARARGTDWILTRIADTMNRKPTWPFWLHFDVDVLDQTIMPAVDSPGSPGIDLSDLQFIMGSLTHDPRCAGMTVTIFDPDLDPDGRYARLLVAFLDDVLG